MAITIKDIAKICGVSYTTVSRALNNDKEINQDTRKKIMKIAQSLDYIPNAIARGLVKNKTNMVGLLIPDITTPYWPEVAKGVEDFANEQGYQVFLCNTDWSEAKEILYKETLLEKRVDGLIVGPVSERTSHLFIEKETPIVFLESRLDNEQSSFIAINNVEGGIEATKHLLDLGHKQIACIVGKEDIVTHKQRLMGYKEALGLYNIEVDNKLITMSRNNTIEAGYDAVARLLKNNVHFTAIFALNDILALGAIKAFEDFSLSIPEDISIIGYDDIMFAAFPKINLTTVRQPKYDMGRLASEILIEKIRSKNTMQPRQIILSPSLVIRNTCNKNKNLHKKV